MTQLSGQTCDQPTARTPSSSLRLPLSATVVFSMLLAGTTALADASEESAATPQPTPRIIGGQATNPGDFPSVVAMLQNIDGPSQFQRQSCGATLIAPTWVITAAHCVLDDGNQVLPNNRLTVLAGITDLDTASNVGRGDEIAVVNIIPHPGFDQASFHNDIALMELAEPVDQPIVGLYSGTGAELEGQAAVVVGWGAVDVSDPANPRFPFDQQFVSVPVVSNALCNAPVSYNGAIIDSQICAGLPQGGIDSCQGDSGGPMIIGLDGLQVQIGIVSYGTGCAEPNFFGVYTNVSSYRGWISNFVSARFLPADSDVPDDGLGGEGDPQNQSDLVEQSVFGSGSSGGGAGSWWLLLALGGLLARGFRQR